MTCCSAFRRGQPLALSPIQCSRATALAVGRRHVLGIQPSEKIKPLSVCHGWNDLPVLHFTSTFKSLRFAFKSSTRQALPFFHPARNIRSSKRGCRHDIRLKTEGKTIVVETFGQRHVARREQSCTQRTAGSRTGTLSTTTSDQPPSGGQTNSR